jgi:hypothetical protein
MMVHPGFPRIGGLARANRAALLAERSQDGESEASIERANGRMPEASVRRDGTGEPGFRRLTRRNPN